MALQILLLLNFDREFRNEDVVFDIHEDIKEDMAENDHERALSDVGKEKIGKGFGLKNKDNQDEQGKNVDPWHDQWWDEN